MGRKVENRVIRVYGIFGDHRAGSIYSVNGLCPTLDANGGGYHKPLILLRNKKVKGDKQMATKSHK